MRLGIFGGSFDPIHLGHLILAECCREQQRLDQVWFMPAHTPPHKQNHTLVPGADRTEMLKLATGGHDSFHVSTLELDRGGVSYTVDTLERLKAADATRELFLILGADSLADLPNWRDPERICELSTPIVVRRAGSVAPDFNVLSPFVSSERVRHFESAQVEMPLIGISSSDIRRRVAEGRSIRFLTPRAVEKYIETHGLYQTQAAKIQ
jgi:nicotinate-nucleotide adenylyltransferase